MARDTTASLNRRALRHLRAADPILAGVIRDVGPCLYANDTRITPFAALASSIVYQQISGYAAAAILRRLQELCGGSLEPHPLREASDEALRAVGLSRQKAAYIRDLARNAEESFDRRSLSRMSDERVIETLTTVKGVGRWTAEMFLMFRLGRLDILPVSDLGIQKAMAVAYRKRGLPKAKWMHKQSKAWSPYRTIASWYLWQSIDNAPRKPRRLAKSTKQKAKVP
jgi:3-methyladenine DNA glycosylase/8-oxoguanine DNA glycosylase